MRDLLVRFASAAELEARARASGLHEGTYFDAKQELPSKTKNRDLAVDIAAMSTYGGTIVFGIAEDDSGEPTIPAPLALVGVKERLSNIAASAIAPPVQVVVTALPKTETEGYVVLAVPRSSLSPHMVAASGCYYARNAQGNYRLTEAQVEDLYAQRQAMVRSAEEALEPRLSSLAQHAESRRLAVLLAPTCAAARSLADLERADCRALLDRAWSDQGRLVRLDTRNFVLPNWRVVDDGFGITENGYELRVTWDLEASLVDTTAIYSHEGTRYVSLPSVVDSVARLLLFGGALTAEHGYHGPLNVGVKVIGLKDTSVNWPQVDYRRAGFPKYPAAEYSRFMCIDGIALRDDPGVAVRELLHRFVRAASGDSCSS